MRTTPWQGGAAVGAQHTARTCGRAHMRWFLQGSAPEGRDDAQAAICLVDEALLVCNDVGVVQLGQELQAAGRACACVCACSAALSALPALLALLLLPVLGAHLHLLQSPSLVVLGAAAGARSIGRGRACARNPLPPLWPPACSLPGPACATPWLTSESS